MSDFQKIFQGGVIQPQGATTFAPFKPRLTNLNQQFVFSRASYAGRGYPASRPIPPNPALTGTPAFVPNTELELANIVYPDGVRKNSSYTQAASDAAIQGKALRRKIGGLRQAALTAAAPVLADQLNSEADAIEQQYFPQEFAIQKQAEQIAELKALKASSNLIGFNAAQHAKAASQERSDLLDELQALRASGIVSGSKSSAGIPQGRRSSSVAPSSAPMDPTEVVDRFAAKFSTYEAKEFPDPGDFLTSAKISGADRIDAAVYYLDILKTYQGRNNLKLNKTEQAFYRNEVVKAILAQEGRTPNQREIKDVVDNLDKKLLDVEKIRTAVFSRVGLKKPGISRKTSS